MKEAPGDPEAFLVECPSLEWRWGETMREFHGVARRRMGTPRQGNLIDMIAQLRDALLGLAERDIPGDPLPCFCVHYEAGSGVHDEWCEGARIALAETGDITVLLDDKANVVRAHS